ncbi:Hypothetical predicted protein [Cloeon dipterum]|uniref:Uncharacterized protein n=1 Tax=Cloeon dipterum TaxID=197152 RepID=A0A8S1E8F1_9INSE|nr:Hypothetical predicted protein [Cloeon dipterum]
MVQMNFPSLGRSTTLYLDGEKQLADIVPIWWASVHYFTERSGNRSFTVTTARGSDSRHWQDSCLTWRIKAEKMLCSLAVFCALGGCAACAGLKRIR